MKDNKKKKKVKEKQFPERNFTFVPLFFLCYQTGNACGENGTGQGNATNTLQRAGQTKDNVAETIQLSNLHINAPTFYKKMERSVNELIGEGRN